MSIGVLVSLPSQVELFDPVVRRLRGARFALAPGRWPSAVRDSRRWTLHALARRGWVAEENAHAGFDLLLCGNHVSPEAAQAWLRPGGKVALWRVETRPGRLLRVETGTSNRLRPVDPVALVCAPSEPYARGVAGCPVSVTGDPRLDSLHDVAAASRARTHLGLDSERPVVLVLLDRSEQAVPAWTHAVASLRADHQVVLWAHDRCWLQHSYPFGRALTGPGLRFVDPDHPAAFADLLAAADLVLAGRGRSAAVALRAGRRVLLLQENPGQGRSRVKSFADPLCTALQEVPYVEDPAHLHGAVAEALREPEPGMHSTVREGRAALRLAQAVQSASALLVGDLPAGQSRD